LSSPSAKKKRYSRLTKTKFGGIIHETLFTLIRFVTLDQWKVHD